MSKIHLMKPELSNLIAAGEVIERPSSVVKELVENSIDAHAKNIYVGILSAGRGKILVKDDGDGMDKEDARNCFLRHASSKIKTEFDLTRIKTMGFRGEAIPSIASVSKVTLTTSDGNGAGTKVESEPDKELVLSPAPSRKGTIFEVRDLFFNTPARLKYLKSDKVETYSIVEQVEHLALGFPEISFSLAIDGREVLHTTGRGDLLEAISKIYGNRIADSLYEVEHEGLYFSFRGFVSKPELSYSKKYNMLLYLNNRSIYDYPINKSIEEAYRDYLPPLRYPFSLIKLDIDPALVDVNVHPSKKEVRISMEGEMASILKNTIVETLKAKRPLYDLSHDAKGQNDLGMDAFDVEDLKEEEGKKIEEGKEDFDKKEDKIVYFQDSLPSTPSYVNPHPVEKKEFVLEPKKTSVSQDGKKDFSNIFSEESYTLRLPEMHPIGQVLKTYIVCDGPDGFYLIDQHAANERINFEKTERLFSQVRSRVVPLLPMTVELSFKEQENLDEEHLSRLLSCSIVVEKFGERTLIVREIPSFLSDPDYSAVILDCVHAVLNDEKADPLKEMRLAIANIACKKSIRANETLTMVEMESLIQDLAKCVNPANCPHGRPTLIKLSRSDVEKLFRRTGF